MDSCREWMKKDAPDLNTAVDLKVLTAVAKTITNVPPDKKF